MLAAVRRGDTVVTGGGLIGKVTKVIDDNELEVDLGGGTKVTALRSTIAEVRVKGEPVANHERQEMNRNRGGTGAVRAESDREQRLYALFLTLEDRSRIWLVVAHQRPVRRSQPASRSTLGRHGRSWVPKKQMTLGLDLQGGSHILLEVDRQDIDRRAAARRRATKSARCCATPRSAIPASAAAGRPCRSASATPPTSSKARTALHDLLTSRSPSGVFGTGSRAGDRRSTSRSRACSNYTLTDAGIDYRASRPPSTQSIEVVGRRVNELGTTEPIIQRQGTDRILVQVPGLQDPQRLKDILGQTAKLTFQMVDQSMPVQEAINGRPPAGSIDHVLARTIRRCRT